jgi:glutathione S-transferase
VARLPATDGGGVKALTAMLEQHPDHAAAGAGPPPFAAPILRHGPLVLAQTASILQYLGPRLGLVPADEPSRIAANQVQLTVTDFVLEVHDVHHPIANSLYYEDQKPESARRAELFIKQRIPKYLGYFERVLSANRAGAGRHAVGDKLSYVDLSLFQVMTGMAYAFPNAMARVAPKLPLLSALRDAVAALPSVAAYLASARRIPFNQHGVFRHYPELDP